MTVLYVYHKKTVLSMVRGGTRNKNTLAIGEGVLLLLVAWENDYLTSK